ncbi:hypothetical protein E5082_31915 [Streptomyces griseoluteus]|uniref:Uncharacterized protein n=1 Tax=Streptomyces griseoluteus TaxID=29306 RepID=A0A4Z1CX23_STRGP|nr:hypothetical protein [Streptomyces griseoluteus]TGN73444.1 hypothetical protein E5082_31915 [Streptomyces griseoluteus]GHF33202.1 hypothetical protein GCM10017776_59630 [Streptomyces griseoluteus]
MLSFDSGNIAALAVARWRKSDGSNLDAIFSTRYKLADARAALPRPQFRRMEAQPSFDGKRFHCAYNGYIQELPLAVEGDGLCTGNTVRPG